MNINDLFGSINELYTEYLEIISNPNYCIHNKKITWSNHQDVRLKNEFDIQGYKRILNNRQYSFLITPENQQLGIIQLNYKFDATTDDLCSANLCYYGAPIDIIIDTDNLISSKIDIPSDSTTITSIIPSMRIDYDVPACKDIVHPDSHFHFSGHNSTRIAVHGVPTPKQFIETILVWYYPDFYHSEFISKSNNTLDFIKTRKSIVNHISFDKIQQISSQIIMTITIPPT